MAYNRELAERVRSAMRGIPDLREKKMFGGLSFLHHGKMTVGIVKEDLAVRVIAEKMEESMQNPHVRPMDFTKKPMKEFVYVSEGGFTSEEQ